MAFRSLRIIPAIAIALSVSINAAAMDYEIPAEVQTACDKYGEEYDISPELLLAIIRYESCYVPDVSNGNCKGLMQINTPYHKNRMQELGITDIYDIDSNIHVGADYIAELYEDYDDYGIVLGIYHGETNAVINAEKGNYSKYTKKVLEYAADLEEELNHGKE